MLENWSAWVVLGLAVACVVAVVAYFSSTMSLDKLKPAYAGLALDAVEQVDHRLSTVAEDKRSSRRAATIRAARATAAKLEPPQDDKDSLLAEWLGQQEPEVVLQFLVNPHSQLRLRVLEPTLHAQNLFQMVAALLVAAIALAAAFLTIHTARSIGFPANPNPDVSDAVRLLGYALFFFALYPLCYYQTRVQIQEFVGEGFSVLQDYFSAAMILLVLMMLNWLEPTEKLFSIATLSKYLPVIVITGGFAAEGLTPGLLRQILGRETTWGIQFLLAVLFGAMASVPLVAQLIAPR